MYVISLIDCYKQSHTVIIEKIYYDVITGSARLIENDSTRIDTWKITMTEQQFDDMSKTVVNGYIDMTDFVAKQQSENEYETEIINALEITVHDEEFGDNCDKNCSQCVISHCCPKRSKNYNTYDYDHTTQNKIHSLINSVKTVPDFTHWKGEMVI